MYDVYLSGAGGRRWLSLGVMWTCLLAPLAHKMGLTICRPCACASGSLNVSTMDQSHADGP